MSKSFEYNPDVLTCLSNLSNDEVFTPPKIVNQMLDMLPSEIWSDKNAKFLDPCCKSGVFLREITKRLIDNLPNKDFKTLQEKIDHILTKQVYGIAITELTGLISRRSIYCSKLANGKMSICNGFKTPDGNIYFDNPKHIWNGTKCSYCGASKIEFDRSNELESHAYKFIHIDSIEEVFKMKFDVVIGNPPYQLNDGGGTGDSAKPIYNKFIEQAMNLNPRFICMIVPSRWMKGGKGLDKFREMMISDSHIKTIFDFEDAKECFPGVNIDGGINYFLWDKNYKGPVDYTYKNLAGEVRNDQRYLRNDISNIVIRDSRQLSIIRKSRRDDENAFSSIVSNRNPYGINADFFNDPEKYKDIKSSNTEFKNSLKIYGVKGKKGGSKRTYTYIDANAIEDNDWNYKLLFSKAYDMKATVPPKIILAEPNEVCTETFLKIGDFKTKKEAENCLSYIKTKFFRALLSFRRHSLNISKECFDFIPLVDFSKKWSDEELYAKYNLSNEEVNYIEDSIEGME